jgi:stress-induced morphogen
MSLKLDEIKILIKKAMPDAEIVIKDLAGDDNHYSATIKSKLFSGKTKIEQHKLVYKALNGKMGNELHALELNTIEN